MFKVVILLLLALNLSHSEWIKEGEYFKLNHDLKNIKEMRYSIDTTHIILINDTQINYYNKYTGEFSKSFSVPFESGYPYFEGEFIYIKNPTFSIDEKVITYISVAISDPMRLMDCDEIYFDAETGEVIGKKEQNWIQPTAIHSQSYYGYVFKDKNGPRFRYYTYSYQWGQINQGAKVRGYDVTNSYNYPSASRIENITGINFNTSDNSIMYFMDNELIVETPDSNITILEDEENFICSNFSKENNTIFYITKNTNNNEIYYLNKYNYNTKELKIRYEENVFNKFIYLNSEYFISQDKKTNKLTLFSSNHLEKLIEFDFNKNAERIYFDSLNSDLFIESGDNSYKYNIDLNKRDFQAIGKFEDNADIVDSVHFYNISIGEYDEITWDFGDGNISNDEHPIHKFENGGTYKVKLTIKNNDSTSSFSKNITIFKNVNSDFYIDILNKDLPINVKLTSRYKNKNLNYSWFLNGKHKSFDEDITIELDFFGNNKVTLLVFDEFSYDIKTKDLNLVSNELKDTFGEIDVASSKYLTIDYFENDSSFILHDTTLFTYYRPSNYSDYVYKDKKYVNELFFISNNEITKKNYEYKKIYHEELDLEYDEEDYGFIDLPDESFKFFYILNDELNLIQITPFNHYKYTYYEYNNSGRYNYDLYNYPKYYYKHSIFYKNNENVINDFLNKRNITSFRYKINHIIINNRNVLLNYGSNLLTIDTKIDKIDFINENNIKIYDPILFSYKNNYKLFGNYFDTKGYYLYYDVTLNSIDTNANKILINIKDEITDIKSINNYLYLKYNNKKLYKYDIENDEILNTIESELDTIQILDELNGNLVMFGRKNGKLAYQIKNDDDSYFYAYNFDGDYINAKTNNKDKYVAQIKLDSDTINTYVIYTDIYSALSVNENKLKPKIIKNKIVFTNPITHIYIYDILGRIVELKENYNNREFDFSHLKSDFYLYRIISDGEVYTGKFIK